MKKSWLYYGVFFSDKTKRALLEYARQWMKKCTCPSDHSFEFRDDWKIYCDHMTLVYNDGSEKAQEDANFYENVFPMLCEVVSLRITHIGYSNRAIALQVDYQTSNKISHITVATAPDAKPVESNNINYWVETDGAFYVTGQVHKVETSVKIK